MSWNRPLLLACSVLTRYSTQLHTQYEYDSSYSAGSSVRSNGSSSKKNWHWYPNKSTHQSDNSQSYFQSVKNNHQRQPPAKYAAMCIFTYRWSWCIAVTGSLKPLHECIELWIILYDYERTCDKSFEEFTMKEPYQEHTIITLIFHVLFFWSPPLFISLIISLWSNLALRVVSPYSFKSIVDWPILL